MKQYEFRLIHRTRGTVDQARATAATESIARAAVVEYYGDAYTVGALLAERAAHQVVGEIDCAGVTP